MPSGRRTVVLVAQHWSPMSQLQRGVEQGTWLMFDRSKRIAILRVVDIHGVNRKLIRSVTYDADPTRRQLIGYFPNDAVGLRLAATVTWQQWIEATGPSQSNRR